MTAIMRRTVLIRTDGSVQIGMGHVMRCIGLAQALRDAGYAIIFVLAEGSPPVIDRLRLERFAYSVLGVERASERDLECTVRVCQEQSASLVIVDGYAFSGEWLGSLRERGPRIMLWTDYLQSAQLPVDLILDQTPAAPVAEYKVACPRGTILAGLKYAVLRSEFLNRQGLRHRRERVGRVLITLGGSDPDGVTLLVLSSLRSAGYSFAIDVVIGPASTHGRAVRAVAQTLSNCTVYQSVSDMSELIMRADLAISAAGTTLWEFAYSGLPTIAITIADNQMPLARALGEFGGGFSLGAAADVSAATILATLDLFVESLEVLAGCSEKMMAHVDGLGVNRVVTGVGYIFR